MTPEDRDLQEALISILGTGGVDRRTGTALAEAITSYLQHSQKYALIPLRQVSISGEYYKCGGAQIRRAARRDEVAEQMRTGVGVISIARKMAAMGKL